MIHLHPALKQEDVAKLEAKTGMRARLRDGKAVLEEPSPMMRDLLSTIVDITMLPTTFRKPK